LSQLLQAHLASQFLGLGLITLPSSMLQIAVQAYRDKAQKVTVSKSQRQVGESLRRLGISHELEYTTADGLFSIDLAVVDRRIAIEFDGPSHFTVNTLEPLGHTRLRDRLLSAMGWHVVSIPFFEWDRLQRPEQMDAYVEHRVQREGPARLPMSAACGVAITSDSRMFDEGSAVRLRVCDTAG
jgi:very-short-patch-repair endonuclease